MLQEAVSFVPVSGLFAFVTCDVSHWNNHVAPRHQQRAVCTCLREVLREEPALTQLAFTRLLEWLDDGSRLARREYLEMRRRLVSHGSVAIGRLLMSWRMRRSIVSAERSSRPA